MIVVEVAVGSHAIDRGVKAFLYAQADVPIYWLIDVPGKAIEVRTNPGPSGYETCKSCGLGASVPSPVEGVAALDVGSLFD